MYHVDDPSGPLYSNPEVWERTSGPMPSKYNTMSTAVVGYTGFIPQKYVENVFGHNFHRSNQAAHQLVLQHLATGYPPLPPDATGLSLSVPRHMTAQDGGDSRPPTILPRIGIPGYTGYFPRYMMEQKWLAKTFLDRPLE